MNNNEKIKKSLIDALMWVGLTSIIGLTQLLLYLTIAFLVDGVDFQIQEWVKNGAIVAFSLALVSSIFFDRHFQEKHDRLIKNNKVTKHSESRAFDSLFYKLLPWLIVAVVVVSTLLSALVDDTRINKGYLLNMQIASIAFSYLYTLYYKFCSYYIGFKNAI